MKFSVNAKTIMCGLIWVSLLCNCTYRMCPTYANASLDKSISKESMPCCTESKGGSTKSFEPGFGVTQNR